MGLISPVYHSRHDVACEHCAGTEDHEPWCILENTNVYYAFNIILHPEAMTEQDRIILHALGIVWTPLLTSNSFEK
jgi:hypothetical protein